jgi:hypothetical protein
MCAPSLLYRTNTVMATLGSALSFSVHWNLGLTNLKGPKILLFIAGVLLLQGFLSIVFCTEGLKIKVKVKIKVLYCRNFVIEGVVITRFQCTTWYQTKPGSKIGHPREKPLTLAMTLIFSVSKYEGTKPWQLYQLSPYTYIHTLTHFLKPIMMFGLSRRTLIAPLHSLYRHLRTNNNAY